MELYFNWIHYCSQADLILSVPVLYPLRLPGAITIRLITVGSLVSYSNWYKLFPIVLYSYLFLFWPMDLFIWVIAHCLALSSMTPENFATIINAFLLRGSLPSMRFLDN